MATKTLEVVVCDFPHKRDKPAVNKVTIDVCAHHEEMLGPISNGSFTCAVCGRSFKTKQGLGKHKSSAGHNGVDA